MQKIPQVSSHVVYKTSTLLHSILSPNPNIGFYPRVHRYEALVGTSYYDQSLNLHDVGYLLN
jgi:hypothetical protein